MTRTCTVCTSAYRELIDKRLLEGSTLRELTEQYGVSKSALSRHRAEHMNLAMIKAAPVEVIAGNASILDQLRSLHGRTLKILSDAEASRDGRLAAVAVREARGNLELLLKVDFLLADRQAKQEQTESQDSPRVVFVNLADRDGTTTVGQRVRQVEAFVQDLQARKVSTDLAMMSRENVEELIHDLHTPIRGGAALVRAEGNTVIYMPDDGRNPPMVEDVHGLPHDEVERKAVEILRRRGYTVIAPNEEENFLAEIEGKLDAIVKRREASQNLNFTTQLWQPNPVFVETAHEPRLVDTTGLIRVESLDDSAKDDVALEAVRHAVVEISGRMVQHDAPLAFVVDAVKGSVDEATTRRLLGVMVEHGMIIMSRPDSYRPVEAGHAP